MCKCFKCEMLIDDEPIKVVDFPANSPFSDDIYHFEEGLSNFNSLSLRGLNLLRENFGSILIKNCYEK